MKVRMPNFRWLLVLAIVPIGVILTLGIFAASASASTDSVSPWVIKIDPKDIHEPDTVDIDADYLDMESGIEVEEVALEVPDAVVSSCTKTSNHVKCKATNLKHGDHDAVVKVKDKSGNTSSSCKRFSYDKVAPAIGSLTADTSGVSVKFSDPAPSSGIASVVVTVDGNVLNCRANGTGCDDDHDGYDHDHDGYDSDNDSYDDDHDGYDDDHDGNDADHSGYYEDSNGGRHDSDGYYHDNDDDRDGATSGSYTCPLLGSLGCGSHQVVVTITDKAGHVTTGNAVINNGVCDLIAPTTTDNAPAGWQNTDVNVALTCTDNAGGSGCASTSYEVDGGVTQTGNSVSLTTEGIHTVAYRSTDNNGNVEATKTATVMIDKTPPAVTTSGDATVEATSPSGAAVDFTSSATDALSGAGPVSCDTASGATFALGATVVTCSASDAAGNSGSASLTITVVDTTPPALTMPADVTAEATGPATAVTFGSATATDIVDGADAVTCSAASGDSFAVGAATVTCSATDAHGNSSSGSFTVTVTDTTAPALTLPADMIVQATGPTAQAIFTATATDLVDGTVLVTCTPGTGDFFPIGTTFVSCSATDAAGNVSTGTFSVTVCQSGRPPLSIICPPVVNPNDPAQDIAWKDKANRILTIKYTFRNGVGPDAYNVQVLSSGGPRGIVCLTPLPLTVGDIPSGGSVKVALDYYYPLGVPLSTTVSACAADQCGNVYI